jgi:hypothetical protein
MAKVPCYVCKKLGNHIYTIKDYWRSPQTPKGMTENDRVCDECYHKVKREVIQYKKEHKEENKRLEKKKEEEEKIIIGEIANKYQKYGVVKYKDEYCAILEKISGERTELLFIKEFSKLTQEGYRLMAQDEGGSFHLGLESVGSNSFYFFQKIEYITPK